MPHPIAITGLGIVTAQGIGLDATWAGVTHSKHALRPWSHSPPHLAKIEVAECPELPAPPDLPLRLWKKLSRTQQLAAIAMDEALASAHLPPRLTPSHTPSLSPPLPSPITPSPPPPLYLATTVCGMDINERFYAQFRTHPDTADLNLMRRLEPFGLETLLARRHNLTGLNQVFLSTCVGSAMAIGAAADAIALGECDLAIAGGAEALCQVVLAGFNALKVVAPNGCRPFDHNRPGITVGEGAAILILESLPHAQKRGIQPLAYLRGFGVTCDAHHITAPDPNATQASRAIRDALHRAALKPQQIQYVNAHGTGTRDNDIMETKALRTALLTPENHLPHVSSTKRCTGHTFGAAGAIEAVLCIQAIRHNLAPANAGSLDPDPTLDLPIVRSQSLPTTIDNALSTNFAFGGNNTALIFSRHAGDPNA